MPRWLRFLVLPTITAILFLGGFTTSMLGRSWTGEYQIGLVLFGLLIALGAGAATRQLSLRYIAAVCFFCTAVAAWAMYYGSFELSETVNWDDWLSALFLGMAAGLIMNALRAVRARRGGQLIAA